MIVADSNVISYLMLPGEHTAAAKALLLREPIWAVPLLWRSEFRNVLATQVRVGLLHLDVALYVQHEAEALLMGQEYTVDSDAVLRLAAHSGCTAYDCEFVSLAKQLDVPLVTMDAKLRKAFPDVAVSL